MTDDIKWVLQALASPQHLPERKNLFCAKVDASSMSLIATDGHRLHMLLAFTDCTEGYLTGEGQHISNQEYAERFGQFPEYASKLPLYGKENEYPLFKWEASGKKGCLDAFFKGNTIRVTKKYLDEAMRGMKNPVMKVGETSNTPILFTEGRRYAVVMPHYLI